MEKKIDMSKYYKFLLYLVIAVLINLVGLRLFFRFDLTANGLYSLSKASKRVVSSLEEPLTINVFFSKNLPAPYNNVERYINDLLEEYSVYSKKYFNYRFFNVTAKEGDISDEAEENRKKAQDYGIYPVNVQKIEQDEATVQKAYMGMVLLHGDIIEKIPAITTTDGLEYKITGAIQKMSNKISALLNLSGKIKVKLVQSSSLAQIAPEIELKGLETLKNKFRDVVASLNSKFYDRLEFVSIDPTVDQIPDEEIRKFERFGLQWEEFTGAGGKTIPAGKGILALGLHYGEKSLETSLLSKSLNLTNQGLQEQFNLIEMDKVRAFIEENIDNVINIYDEIGYLSSHGVPPLSANLPPQFQRYQSQIESLTKFNSLLSKNYSISEINLKEEEIPENIDTLIIAGPKEEFSDWELFQIDQFLMKGKSLALFVESFNEIQQSGQQQMYQMNQPVYLPLRTHLENLLEHYGVNVKKSYVMDKNCYINRDRTAGEMAVYFAPVIKNENINHSKPFMKNIKEMLMIKISPLESFEENLKKNDLKLTHLFSSSNQSWEMSGRINLMPWMIRPPVDEEEMGSRPLAYLVEGEFPSYFADKPVPEKPVKEEEGKEDEEDEEKESQQGTPKQEQKVVESKIKGRKGILTEGKPGKIFLIGTSEILKDNFIDDEGTSPNAIFLLNTIDYLNNQEDIAVMRSKVQRFNPLKDTKAVTRTFVKVLNIAGLPIILILFGFMVWFRRKAKRRMIQAMFLKTKKKGDEQS